MSIRTDPWPDGTPSWADLMTTDQAAAAAFYGDVLGWTVADTGEELGHYGLGMVGEQAAAGMMQRQPGDTMPPAWTTYLATSDVDKTCDAITSNGGTVVMAPMDVAAQGRMAVAQDPTGAFFGLWQAGEMIGAGIVNEPGGIVWNECMTRDAGAAQAFYTAVFGFAYTAMEGEASYHTIDGAGPGNTIGGIGQLDAAVPAEVPPHWMVYFAVADADAAVAKVRAGGGTVLQEPFDTPYGRMARVSDPQGAVFSLAQV